MKQGLLKLSVLALMIGVASCQEDVWNDGNKLSEDQSFTQADSASRNPEIQRTAVFEANDLCYFDVHTQEEIYTIDTLIDPLKNKIFTQKNIIKEVNETKELKQGSDQFTPNLPKKDKEYRMAIWWKWWFQEDVMALNRIGLVEGKNYNTEKAKNAFDYYYITLYKTYHEETKSAYWDNRSCYFPLNPIGDKPVLYTHTHEQYRIITQTIKFTHICDNMWK